MSQHRYVCQTPQSDCDGGKTGTSQGLNRKDSMKAHGTPEEAFRCYARYLQSQGYNRLSSREYQRPGEPIELLTKPCRYGAPLRKGKNELKGKGGKRYMPAIVKGGIIRG